MSRAPARASSASRQRTSARRLSIARRAPAPSRSVMTPVTCGTSASASNAVPPLKSASRKLTSRVECVGAQREDPGDQQLGLARPGDARDDGVRPVGDEVDHARLARLDADHRGQARRASRAAAAAEQRAERDRLPTRRAAPSRRAARAASSAARRSRLRAADGFDGDLAHLAADVDACASPGERHREHDPAARWRRHRRVGAHDRDVGVRATRLARRAERERHARGRAPMRQPLGPGVLAAQRTDDPQLARAAASCTAAATSARTTAAASTGLPTTAIPDGRRHDDGRVLEPRGAGAQRRGIRIVPAAGDAHVARVGARARRRVTSPRPGTGRQISPSRRDERRDVRMPRPAPRPLVGVALPTISPATRSRARARLRVRAPAVSASPAGAVEHRRAGDQRAERREPQRRAPSP